MLYTVFSGQWLSGLGYQRDHLVHVKTGLGLPTGTKLKKKKKISPRPCRPNLFLRNKFAQLFCEANQISTVCSLYDQHPTKLRMGLSKNNPLSW